MPTGPGGLRVLEVDRSWRSMDPGGLWVLEEYRSWMPMGLGGVPVLDAYRSWMSTALEVDSTVVHSRIWNCSRGHLQIHSFLDSLEENFGRDLRVAAVHMCLWTWKKAYDQVPRSILWWGVLREYGLEGPLIRAVQSLYQRSRSLVWIAGCMLDSFPVRVGLPGDCPLSLVLFINFMDRISRRSRGGSGWVCRVGGWKISSLLSADDVVLLAPSNRDLQQMLGRFATECEAAGMRISTSKSESLFLARKKVRVPFRVGEEVLPQVEEFKYLGILFTS
ncbi:hypothetical protein D4764_15G0005720 [Takifugu flavidus]|uniref:Reverse transcriptase domain-containing protein n=1 Tax=Takifugu flavidus TaxID=433684 RepID=A0A5C6P204_9TELE|nr:hypothetical protein D4764_15G0005720 [Takifugu flavidus]